MASDVNKEMQDLKSDFGRLRTDIDDIKEAGKRQAEELSQKLEAESQRLSERLKHGLEDIRDRGRHYVDEAKDKGMHAVESLEEQVEERPLISMVTAFGVGVLIGTLLGRR